MEALFYQMIFKRKSFHLFKETMPISETELQAIENMYQKCKPLVSDIKTEMKIVPADQTTCKRGQEYCILLYSEKRDRYLQNIGYIGEQLDLYLASLGIGTLWFGIGKTEKPVPEGMDFVIMIAIAKVAEDKFRKDMFKSKRKPLQEIWVGEPLPEVGDIVRFAPSACNTQPWLVEYSKGKLEVFRYKKPGKRGIMPAHKVIYYNQIDMGIFLLFLELCLTHQKIPFERTLYTDSQEANAENTLAAVYQLGFINA